MIDAHVHLEKGPYTREWLQEFIFYAQERGIREIYFLEHTHIFRECSSLYSEMSQYNGYQQSWYCKKLEKSRPLIDYLLFADKMRRESFPVKVRFGLEVCYSQQHEKEIEKLKNSYSFDFLVGAVHFIDGWAFSHLRQPWKKEDCDLNKLYYRYYELLLKLADSGLFTGLAHPNSLQCFGAYPVGNYDEMYEELAGKLRRNGMYIEESSGLAINYGDRQLGMNRRMLEIMKKGNVSILTASDAHIPRNVGLYFKEMTDIMDGICTVSQHQVETCKGLLQSGKK